MGASMRRLIVFLVLVSSASAYADDWIYLTSNSADTKVWHGLAKSYELRNNKKGDEIAVWTEKEDDKKTNRITIQKMYVKTADCLKKQGKSVVVNMDGDFLYDYDFIFGVETVGSYRAEQLCKIYLSNVAETMGKGL
jgi:hypothetical protein